MTPASASTWMYRFWTPHSRPAAGNARSTTSGKRLRASSTYGSKTSGREERCHPSTGLSRAMRSPMYASTVLGVRLRADRRVVAADADEAEEVLERIAPDGRDPSGDDRDDRDEGQYLAPARPEADARREPEDGDSHREPACRREGSRDDESQDAGDEREPEQRVRRSSRLRDDAGYCECEGHCGERGEVVVAEERGLPPAGVPCPEDVDAEELQERHRNGNPAQRTRPPSRIEIGACRTRSGTATASRPYSTSFRKLTRWSSKSASSSETGRNVWNASQASSAAPQTASGPPRGGRCRTASPR